MPETNTRKTIKELFKDYPSDTDFHLEEFDWGPAVGDEWDWSLAVNYGKVYITGDTHRNFQRIHNFCKLKKTSTTDTLIILGDAGINFYLDESDAHLKEELNNYPITLFCIHGNHEERPFLIQSYKEMLWHGGIVYYEEAYPNLLFAKDGEIYDFLGKRCIVMGGAYSIDKEYRLEHNAPWFPSEQPSSETKAYVESQLDSIQWTIDYVFSHTIAKCYEPTWSFKGQLSESQIDKSTELWLDDIEAKLSYTRWFAGHYHVDVLSPDIRLMFNHIIELDAHDVLYHKDDEVYFVFNKELKQGLIDIVDFYGTFFDPNEVSYDILTTDTNTLYKGIRNSDIVTEPSDEQLALLRQEQLSTFLHKIMHNSRETALVFDAQGWISLDILIEFINHQKNWNISKSDLDKLIINNTQLRYTFNHDNSKLRGNPIPRIDFDIPLNIPTAIPPAYLYYGYGQSSDIWIERHGLCLLEQLQYIVLASSADTALDLASWIYEHTYAWRIHAQAMHEAGYLFYHTDDDLWLVCESIPYEYIDFLR